MQTTQLIYNFQEEKKDSIDNFRSGLVDFLIASEDITLDIIDDYNNVIMLIMDQDKAFQKDLENALYNNQQKLTDKNILFKDKNESGTVGNWLKDFIKYHGSSYFDNFVISKYLTLSDNCKQLGDNEKNLVKKLLVLYRNVKYFPESQRELPIEMWQIIPVEKDRTVDKARTVSGPPKTIEEKQIDQLVKIQSDDKTNPLARRALDEEIEAKKKIENLKILASRYKDGSLERKAIDDEVKRLGS